MNTHRITRTSFGLWVRCFVKLAHISPLELSYITHCWWHWRNVMKGNLMLMQIIKMCWRANYWCPPKHLVEGGCRVKKQFAFFSSGDFDRSLLFLLFWPGDDSDTCCFCCIYLGTSCGQVVIFQFWIFYCSVQNTTIYLGTSCGQVVRWRMQMSCKSLLHR